MKKQIIISGGLGNQMFQYAFYLSMQAKGVACEINTSLYDVVNMHNGFELSRVFGIDSEVGSTIFSRFLVRFFGKYKIKHVVYSETPYVFNSQAYGDSSIIYNGNWICEDYFKEIELSIRNIYRFINIDVRNMQLAKELTEKNSVSLHIRRGDYLKFPSWNVCDENYYCRAIEYIKKYVKDPLFYVFSDDPDWCESFMTKMSVPFRIVKHNREENNYKDMYLMSCCKHNINANSTFSWWGAWLNRNKNKIVIMPTIWTKDTNENPACNNWIKL